MSGLLDVMPTNSPESLYDVHRMGDQEVEVAPKPRITLTEDQRAAHEAFAQLILHKRHHIMVIKGYAGTGKTSLVQHIINELPTMLKMARVVTREKELEVVLSATTNKAVEALAQTVSLPVRTIQSVLGLVVKKDYSTQETTLALSSRAEILYNTILFIDEASFIDQRLFDYILERTSNCKIVFIGDPAQLASVKSNKTPVFSAGYPTVSLEKIVRQPEGNQIVDLATAFRNTVNGYAWPEGIVPDGEAIIYQSRPDFNEAIVKEFTRPDWHFTDSKVLAWTNKRVTEYSGAIRNKVMGDPVIQIGDYVTCNSHISTLTCRLKTDAMVQITGMYPVRDWGYEGWRITLDNKWEAFMPLTTDIRKEAAKVAKKADNFLLARAVDENWIDLRAVYACTINKSQGSTYDKVFIDLDDISKCNQGNQIARMMYVAVSRARHQVYLTGDIFNPRS